MGRRGRNRRAARAGSATRRWSAALHRWLGLLVAAVLVFQLASGTLLLYRPEIFALTHPELFAATAGTVAAGPAEALAALHRALPQFSTSYAASVEGVWQIWDADYHRAAYIDPGTGNLLGTAEPDGGFWGVLLNLHDCGLSCETHPGYVAALNVTVPGADELTWGGLVLGVLGLALLLLTLSGTVAWWPSMGRFLRALRTKMRPRLDRGAYRAHRDLHDVGAVLALPLIVVWAVTGAGYALPFVGDAWYAVTGGVAPEHSFTADAAPEGAPDIGPDAALAAARTVLPGQELVFVIPPGPDQDHYLVGFQDGVAPARYGGVRTFSESDVAVDPHTGRAALYDGGPGRPWPEWLWESGNYGVHFGYLVPWWARALWFAAGSVSVYLVGSGLWTWWWRRRRIRRAARPVPAPRRAAAAVEQVPAE
ncbi:PepSY domain-containing protein [Pseudonocardia sp. ICBG601]|uniref:PepSY-associated TM helix domain-containing protein n=1 Tax=Pseudonocardia sp. ICBG601 TaxID=2846759 RepID=UPI001CF6AB96|nr:PepSY-associated TM helix domain-containing protein [Pseudonocardia sp. ICBG601]